MDSLILCESRWYMYRVVTYIRPDFLFFFFRIFLFFFQYFSHDSLVKSRDQSSINRVCVIFDRWTSSILPVAEVGFLLSGRCTWIGRFYVAPTVSLFNSIRLIESRSFSLRGRAKRKCKLNWAAKATQFKNKRKVHIFFFSAEAKISVSREQSFKILRTKMDKAWTEICFVP